MGTILRLEHYGFFIGFSACDVTSKINLFEDLECI